MSADDQVVGTGPSPQGEGMGAIVGQHVAIDAIRGALARDRLPHALLFAGPQGVGKATTALMLARALNCATSGPADACGECVSCDKIRRGIHPDVHWIAPTKNVVEIDRIRDVIRAAGYRPHEGTVRVIVIDDAHAMPGPAQNAFLKTLEEPPSSVRIILVTAAPGALLATVHSRCQTLRFSRVGQAAVREYLEQRLGLPTPEAQLRAALTPGSIGSALAIDLDDYAGLLEVVVEALRLSQAGGGGVVAAAEQLADQGHGRTATQRAAAVLRVGRDVLRDLLVVAAGAESAGLVNADRREAWQAWARETDADGVVEALGAINAGIERFTGGIQPNIKMALERTLVEVGAGLSRRRQAHAR